MVLEKLFEIGIAQQLGVFFFLFVVLGAVFWAFVRSVMKENNNRENRYIATIDSLASSLGDVKEVSKSVLELRKDVTEANERQEKMLGRLLDRLPTK